MKTIFVTTSWDDGHILDNKLADLLRKYNIKGTFYIAPQNREFPKEKLLNEQELKVLSQEFEIGAHTVTHPHLSKVDAATSWYEISESKKILETIVNKQVTSFCYPAGKYTSREVEYVEKAGYVTARTVKRFQTSSTKRFEVGTSIHTYDHWSDIFSILRVVNFNPLTFFVIFRRWDLLAIKLFDITLKNGGVFHLWGHSWEIEGRKEWNQLENVLSYISSRKNVTYITNSELYD